MRIFKVHHNGKCEVKGIDNSPEALQAEVGGYIKDICICEEPNITALICADGKFSGFPANKVLSRAYGNVVFVSMSGKKYLSLDDMSVSRLRSKLRLLCAKKASAIYANA